MEEYQHAVRFNTVEGGSFFRKDGVLFVPCPKEEATYVLPRMHVSLAPTPAFDRDPSARPYLAEVRVGTRSTRPAAVKTSGGGNSGEAEEAAADAVDGARGGLDAYGRLFAGVYVLDSRGTLGLAGVSYKPLVLSEDGTFILMQPNEFEYHGSWSAGPDGLRLEATSDRMDISEGGMAARRDEPVERVFQYRVEEHGAALGRWRLTLEETVGEERRRLDEEAVGGIDLHRNLVLWGPWPTDAAADAALAAGASA
eukprot:TRINITY_DN20832_c0_g1_i1.p1 TRINITY_DN20832_c0_g1~~TRINITY_DN20832_c0_g1_i1.p1  ORF type:complete len:254 (+),score=73.18 TRINITY_DN20832_c0_g1_i1:100-861(+)